MRELWRFAVHACSVPFSRAWQPAANVMDVMSDIANVYVLILLGNMLPCKVYQYQVLSCLITVTGLWLH